MSMCLRIVAAAVVLCAVAAGSAAGSSAGVGHAAGTPVTAAKLSVFRPSALPPTCQSQTLVASADTYIWQHKDFQSQNFGTSTVLEVQGKSGQNARLLVRFNLPAAPGCTLVSATLRGFVSSVITGRTLDVYRASTTWDETTVTWSSGAPATAGTAVGATSAAGWMQWAVTAHVQAHYSGTNTGFIIRDSNEGQNGGSLQQFHSREGTNKPELVLQWQ